ncbi:MAG TPA: MaoC/PaaZ C-terminal domain-containing protein [Actinomycetota bacterium]|nr:MaoC/PaaZ C-terminal domain-containing protein [Actinomycetota bacterium]
MELNEALAGKTYPESTYEVTDDAIAAYARATNDPNERYLSRDVVASPVFPVVPAFASFMNAAMDPDLGADVLRLVHGAEEHVLYRPIRPGDVLTVAPVLESVERKDSGETFTVKAALTTAGGEVAAEVRGTMFIRGRGGARRSAAVAADEGAEVVYEETTKVDDDQTQRYAEASGDHNPIHLDESVARMAGLPGIILHGMCTMAIAVKGAVDGLAGGDPTRVRRAGVRFSRPVLPGQELTTRFRRAEAGGGVETFSFTTHNPDGKAVITNGVVEIA